MLKKSKKYAISVIGLGKLGAPMAAVFGNKGFDVIGVDLNPSFVAAINKGIAPVEEPDLQEYLTASQGRVSATLDYNEAIYKSDVSFIIVPTPSAPDGLFSNEYVIEAVKKIGQSLRNKKEYHLVVVTSTVLPGSTEKEIIPALEHSSGRLLGEDLGLCYSPEFIALGSVVRDLVYPDMLLIGESDKKAGDILEDIYRSSVLSKPEFCRMNFVNAELCKISVNTFVTTKISYANMIGDMCDNLPGADARVVTHAVGADSRIGRKYLNPAIGYGGPCFPRDNKAFAALGRQLGVNCTLAEATDAINDYQLQRIISVIDALITSGEVITILGLSYKPHTAVIEQSQGVMLAAMLARMNNYHVKVYDPIANSAAKLILKDSVTFSESSEEAIMDSRAVIVMTPWPQFKELDWDVGLAFGEERTIIDPWLIATPSTSIDLVRLGTGEMTRKKQ